MKNKTVLAIMLTLLFASFLAATHITEAEGTTRVYVNPKFRTRADTPGSSFSINIILEDVAGLYAWEFKLFWDSDVLECVSEIVHIPAGVNWEDPNNYKFGEGIEQDYSPTEGRYGRYFKALVSIPAAEPYPVPFDGTTKLATLTFNVIAAGSCLLDLRDTKLANFENSAIPHNAEDGNFQLPDLAIEPSTRSIFTGTFSVDVTISNVDASVRLVGVDVKIRFDARILTAIAATEGAFISDPAWALHGTQFFGPYFDGDYVGFGILLLPDANGEWPVFPEGEGTLATITFDATVGGSCALELVDTKLSDSDLGRIKHTTVGGSVRALEGAASPDVNGDGIVDIYDIVEAIVAFGATPENPRWNPFIDINVDGIVDIYDIVLIARDFGKAV